MFINIIKFTFIFYYSTLICFKFINLLYTVKQKTFFLMYSFTLAVLTCYLNSYLIELKYTLPLLLLWIAISIISTKPQTAFITSIVAFCISYSIHAVVSLLIDFIFYIASGQFPTYGFLAIASSVIQGILIYYLLKLKRFKKGLPLFTFTKYINIATILCLIFISITAYTTLNKTFYCGFLSFTFILAFLIYWWQAQITKSYRRSLELRELESLRTELQEKNADIQKVMQENERIRFINHRDNNLLSAMEYAVSNYLITDFTDKNIAIEKREELLLELHKIRGDREITYKNKTLQELDDFHTGSSLLDKLLVHMHQKAREESILFTVHQSTNLESFFPRVISEEDFVHLVDDLLKNAFIATRSCEVQMVQLQFYKWNKHLVVEVADSGIPFEVESITNMGITERTTHADTGGSGIGLVDIWNTKEKCNATYHIDEYEKAAPFSKKISLTFDRKNRYSIRTWRKAEILQMSKRADLQIYENSALR